MLVARWSAIIGRRQSQKAESAQQVAARLGAAGFKVGGFVQRAVCNEAGEVIGWDLERIGNRRRVELARTAADGDVCGYRFLDAAFAEAASWLEEPGYDAMVVGSVGKLESARRGHWPALAKLVEAPGAPLAILCVRDSSLMNVALALPDPAAYLELPATPAQIALFADSLRRELGVGRRAPGAESAANT